MDLPEAIEQVEEHRVIHRIGEYPHIHLGEAFALLIHAAQELVRRERGCEFCKEQKSIYHVRSDFHDSMNTDVYVSGNAMIFDIGCHSCGTAEICFCPKCGRKLGGAE